jgi:hypothetical protein
VLKSLAVNFRVSMSTDVVPTDSVVDSSKVLIVVKQHGGSHVDTLIVDFLLSLPIWVWYKQGCPVDVL